MSEARAARIAGLSFAALWMMLLALHMVSGL
jgi:hypothetical protein